MAEVLPIETPTLGGPAEIRRRISAGEWAVGLYRNLMRRGRA